MAITLPVIFIVFYREQVIPHETLMTRITTLALIGLGVTYLLYYYFSEWWAVCQESNVGWFKGFSVAAFTLYLLSLLLELANQTLGFISPEIVSIIENQIHLRTILLVLILIHTLSVAFINSSKNSIKRPKEVFGDEATVVSLWNPEPFPNPILNTFLVMAKSLINATLTLYSGLSQTLRAITNTVKVAIEYISRRILLNNHPIRSRLCSPIGIMLPNRLWYSPRCAESLLLYQCR